VLREKLRHLRPEDAEKIFETLRPFSGMWDGHLGKIEAVQPHIVTSGPPVSSQPYRAGPMARGLLNKEIDRMISMDVIEPSRGP
jgi:hypothetical protein